MLKHFVAHRYQMTAITHLMWNAYFALFLDPGMGKTGICLRVIVNLLRQKKIKGVLIVAPLRPCYSVWPKEVHKWTFARGLKANILHGPDKLRKLREPADIYIINPEGLKWLFTVALKGKRTYPFDMLIVDESGKFKNPDSARLKMMKPKLAKFKRRVILNGTPAPSGIMDLWSQFLIVDMGKAFYRKPTHYRNMYFHKGGYMGREYIPLPDAKERVYKRAAKMCLVMEAKDHLNMPPLTHNTIEVELPDEAYRQYQEIERELFLEIDEDEIEIKNAAVASMVCRQIAGGGMYHPIPEGDKVPSPKHREWYRIHDAKTEALLDLAEELQGKPLLIAYDFQHSLQRIKEGIKRRFGIDAPHIGSGVSAAQGRLLEDQWNRGELRFLLGHPQSIAHGLNIQEVGEDICWYDLTWSLEWYLQLIQRIWRQGMKGECLRNHHLVARGTVDEAMMMRQGERAKEQTELKTALQWYRKRALHSELKNEI